jgi:hypothetical protein
MRNFYIKKLPNKIKDFNFALCTDLDAKLWILTLFFDYADARKGLKEFKMSTDLFTEEFILKYYSQRDEYLEAQQELLKAT